MANRSKSLLWDREGDEYKQLFTVNLAGIRLLRLVRIYRFIDTILAEAAMTETTYSRKTFFACSRHFVMAFVAHQLPELMRRTALGLSEAERRLLSVTVNDVCEEVFEQTFMLLKEQNRRGFSPIFSRIEQVQPLTDRIFNGRKKRKAVHSTNDIIEAAPITKQPNNNDQ